MRQVVKLIKIFKQTAFLFQDNQDLINSVLIKFSLSAKLIQQVYKFQAFIATDFLYLKTLLKDVILTS